MSDHDPDRRLDEGRLDLVPMIDCIMLLLVFFVMTTRFSADEKAIASILPTDRGPVGRGGLPTETVRIAIYPAGMGQGHLAADYQRRWLALAQGRSQVEAAEIRVGNGEPLLVDGRLLRGEAGDPALKAQLEAVHRHLAVALAGQERPGQARKEQREVVIHCFSGLPWKLALVAFDAVRAYEGAWSPEPATGDPVQLSEARGIVFAPPRIRHFDPLELGMELQDLVNGTR